MIVLHGTGTTQVASPMLAHKSLYLSLLGTYLLAAGCSASVEDFANDKSYLECEIRVACGEILDCDDEPVYFETRCSKVNRRRAEECLDKLDEHLADVESDPALCDESYSYAECRQATKRRLRCRIPSRSQPVDGRPLLHDGHAVLPAITTGNAWSERALEVGPIDPAAATQAAAHWLEVARTEHASIAVFSSVSLELMSMGAPPHLLEGCHRAAADEIRHACLALDVARSLGDTSWDLGALPEVPTKTPTLQEIAIGALLEGCIGEGTAAARAHITADRARGPIAEVLRTIARDETRHASLAWATVRWALQRDPSLASELRQALALARAERLGVVHAETDLALAELGVMSAAEASQIECDVLETIVGPVLGRLLHETETAARLG